MRKIIRNIIRTKTGNRGLSASYRYFKKYGTLQATNKKVNNYKPTPTTIKSSVQEHPKQGIVSRLKNRIQKFIRKVLHK